MPYSATTEQIDKGRHRVRVQDKTVRKEIGSFEAVDLSDDTYLDLKIKELVSAWEDHNRSAGDAPPAGEVSDRAVARLAALGLD